jgi:hypothetical protein
MEWYFTKSGRQEGPVSAESLRSMIASGAVAATDLIWREGMAEWTPAGQVAEFAGGGIAVPPGGSQIPQAGPPQPVQVPGAPIAHAPISAPRPGSLSGGMAALWFIFGPCSCGFLPLGAIGHMQMGQSAKGWIVHGGYTLINWIAGLLTLVTVGLSGIMFVVLVPIWIIMIVDYWMCYATQKRRALKEWEFFAK